MFDFAADNLPESKLPGPASRSGGNTWRGVLGPFDPKSLLDGQYIVEPYRLPNDSHEYRRVIWRADTPEQAVAIREAWRKEEDAAAVAADAPYVHALRDSDPPERKMYLGDGAYAAFDGFNVVLTTENGIEVTNTVVLEPEVVVSLLRWLKRLGLVK